jgi:AcrR family transcriptional regulator
VNPLVDVRTPYAEHVPAAAKHPRGRPRGRTKAQTRELILAAAESCFAQWGYDAATNRQIAEAAGVTAGAIYQHFPSKRDLYMAVHSRAYHLINAEFAKVPETTDTFREALIAMLELARRLTTSHSMLALFAVRAPIESRRHADITQEASGCTAPVFAVYMTVAQRALDSGEISGRRVEEVVAGIATLIQGLTQSAWYVGSADEWSALIDRFVGLIPQPSR